MATRVFPASIKKVVGGTAGRKPDGNCGRFTFFTGKYWVWCRVAVLLVDRVVSQGVLRICFRRTLFLTFFLGFVRLLPIVYRYGCLRMNKGTSGFNLAEAHQSEGGRHVQ